jgi:DNA polymerase IV
MDACENVTPTVLESRGHEVLESLLDGPETTPQRLKPDCAAGIYGTNEVVPSQTVVAGKRRWVPAIWHELTKARATKKTPHVVHVEVDELFASVEQVLNPKLRGKPVLVGRGVVASASSEAKLHGVKTGMKLIDAVRVCPKTIVVSGQYEDYAEFAERVRRILESYTPTVETAALDDFYLEFADSGRLYADFEGTLRRLQAEVLGRTGLNVSMGAGRTKVVASIASRLVQPGGLRIVQPGTEETFLAPLPVDKLNGIGRAHAAALADYEVTTIGQLRRIPKPVLAAAFGAEIGEQMWESARGLDGDKSPLEPTRVVRETSIEGGTTDHELLGGLLEYLSERIGTALRVQGRQAGTAGVWVRYLDHSCAQQSIRLARPTNDKHELQGAAKELFAKVLVQGLAVRQVAVSVANIEPEGREQERFGAQESRSRYGNRAADRVPGSYGWNALLQGS